MHHNDWTIDIWAVVFVLLGFIIAAVRGRRMARRTAQVLESLGATWSTYLGVCLSGLPGLEGPLYTTCGGNFTELIFVTRSGDKELGRIPWKSLRTIFAGDKTSAHEHLFARDGIPSLILAQMPETEWRGRREHTREVSYLILDWTDANARPQQTVFEIEGTGAASAHAHMLLLRKQIAGYH